GRWLPSAIFVRGISCPRLNSADSNQRRPASACRARTRLMSQPTSTLASPRSQFIFIILIAGCAIASLGFGPRAALGLFLSPMTEANGWGRDLFAFALALQVLLWGAAQPVAGAFADRYGPVRVLSAGAILYA